MPPSRRYTQNHFRDVAAILAAERAGYGATPALNRITAAFTALFLADSRSAGSRPPYIFDPVLFREVALGKQAVDARPVRRRGRKTPRRVIRTDGPEPGYEVVPGFSPLTYGELRLHGGGSGGSPAPDPAETGPGGVTAYQVSTRALGVLTGMGCMFFACPGPDKPFVSMATCRRCAAIQDSRAMQNRARETTGQETS